MPALKTIEELLQLLQQAGPLIELIRSLFHHAPGVVVQPQPQSPPLQPPIVITPVPPTVDKSVSLSVMTIRDGRDGSQQDVAAILQGAAALMSHYKVKFDSGDQGMPEAHPSDVLILTYYDGVLDLSMDGDGTINQPGVHWSPANQDSWSKSGYQFVLKMMGGQGGNHTAAVQVVHAGVGASRIEFPKAD